MSNIQLAKKALASAICLIAVSAVACASQKINFNVSADADANSDTPAAIDFVMARDDAAYDTIRSYSSNRWFQERPGIIALLGDRISLQSIEVVPRYVTTFELLPGAELPYVVFVNMIGDQEALILEDPSRKKLVIKNDKAELVDLP